MLLGASLATVKSPGELPSKMIRSGRGCCSMAIRNRPAPTHFGVWERSCSGKAKTEPRIWVARGCLCPDGGALWGRAQPNRDSIPPTSSAPLYRLNHSFGLVGGTGEPRELADKAAIKAMLVNRVGDFGLAPGILGCFTLFQTVDFSTIFARASAPRNSWISCNMRLNAITLICILLFIGAVGKSAQIGSHTWSPDAMEGPTPVSALIHAATMVTAGVFMIARCSPLFEYPPTALIVITFAGAMTSFLTTTTGILQNDLKRVIAYSTCSQLGYMIFSCGISNYSVSVFHLMNHAFFKALLFLSAGLVIHAMSDEQDMRKMGGLASSFPFTYAMMLMGSLSLIGFPFLTGFYSKDVILELAYTKYTISGNFAFWLGSVSVLFTSYYSFRSLFLTFLVPTNSFGRDILRWHDAPIPMAIPLILLALGIWSTDHTEGQALKRRTGTSGINVFQFLALHRPSNGPWTKRPLPERTMSKGPPPPPQGTDLEKEEAWHEIGGGEISNSELLDSMDGGRALQLKHKINIESTIIERGTTKRDRDQPLV
ncbi:NADH-ubiquinone oxidoreductase chain 5 [Capsicum annuum]|nr:NADH-ubiquinone oxidoreductase chain 5 [Capsicum annuum]